jgi:acetyl esterase/lipase
MLKKRLKATAIILMSFTLAIGLGLLYFFYGNKAPITQGQVVNNIAYNSKHTLDIYYPTQELFTKPPVTVFIHGGAWMAGRKESINLNRFNGAINSLRNQGFVVISPEYTLASESKAPFPYCVEDAFDALAWLQNNGDSLGFDLNNVGVFGESAGAHIAMMTAFSNPNVVNKQLQIPDLKYVVNVYGPNKLAGIYHMESMQKFEEIRSKLPDCLHKEFDLATYLFGFNPKEDSLKTYTFLEKFSPRNYLTASAPPTLLIHGDADIIVPIDQSLELKPQLDSLGIENEIHILPNVNHAFGGASDLQKDSVQVWIANFIVRHTEVL